MNTITNETTAAAVAMSNDIVQTCMDVNNTLDTQKTVKAFYGTHYANAEQGIFGIVQLVKQVLRENDAVMGRGIENGALRNIAIASAMFTSDIVEAVKVKFASAGMRYKPQAVKNVLSTYAKGDIVKIALSPKEDTPRPCSKPRAKWYLVSTPENPQ